MKCGGENPLCDGRGASEVRAFYFIGRQALNIDLDGLTRCHLIVDPREGAWICAG